MTTTDRDPFAGGEKAPALSFKGEPIGTIKTVIADGPAKEVQQTVFASDPPRKAFWPPNADGSQGNPKMAAVVSGVTPDGEPVSLWAPIPSDMLSKVGAAQRETGHRITAGTRIDVKLVERKPSGKGEPQNIYAVRLTPPAAPAPPAGDPFGAQTPAKPADPWASAPGDEPPF